MPLLQTATRPFELLARSDHMDHMVAHHRVAPAYERATLAGLAEEPVIAH